MTETRSTILLKARKAFEAAFFPDAAFDARVLVAGLLESEPGDLVLGADIAVSSDEIARIEAGIKRRLAHEPVHRILGAREFYGLKLEMSHDTLEPRPDTEMLVDTVLGQIADKNAALAVLDLGTGTGAILLGLLSQLPNAFGTATDISADAVATATRNAATHGFAARSTLYKSNWLENVAGQFDVIVSNPPYVVRSVVEGLDIGVRGYDPIIALDGGEDGLEAYRIIADGVGAHLKADGLLGVEIGYDQRQSVTAMFEERGFACIAAVADYGGQDRVLLFKRKNA